MLTKSAQVENLLDLDHRGHTILCWSLNPTSIYGQFEKTPSLAERLTAMQSCAAAGYLIRTVIMPVLLVVDWEELYAGLLSVLLEKVRLERITLGGICSYPAALRLTDKKLGRSNIISETLGSEATRFGDGRARYPESVRLKIYRHLIAVIHREQPGLPVGLCLEGHSVFETLGMTGSMGKCNCVL